MYVLEATPPHTTCCTPHNCVKLRNKVATHNRLAASQRFRTKCGTCSLPPHCSIACLTRVHKCFVATRWTERKERKKSNRNKWLRTEPYRSAHAHSHAQTHSHKQGTDTDKTRPRHRQIHMHFHRHTHLKGCCHICGDCSVQHVHLLMCPVSTANPHKPTHLTVLSLYRTDVFNPEYEKDVLG